MTPHSTLTPSALAGLEDTTEKMLAVALRTYSDPNERAAMRSALGDAAAICDRFASDILEAGRIRGGYVKKAAREDAALLTAAAEMIWAMREKITVARALAAQQGEQG